LVYTHFANHFCNNNLLKKINLWVLDNKKTFILEPKMIEKKIKIKVLHSHRLIVEYFQGTINLDDVINAKCFKNHHPDFNADYNHLIDFRLANFDANVNDINEVVRFQKENTQFIKKRKSAFLTDLPEHASFTTLFSMAMSDLPIEFEIFTTLEAALNWLDVWNFTPFEYQKQIE